jgi:hypothetical protein
LKSYKVRKNDIYLFDYIGNNIKPIGQIIINSEYEAKNVMVIKDLDGKYLYTYIKMNP